MAASSEMKRAISIHLTLSEDLSPHQGYIVTENGKQERFTLPSYMTPERIRAEVAKLHIPRKF